MKRFLSVILSLSLVVSPVQANECSATDVVAVQRNVTELINELPAKLRVPVHKLLNGDPTWNATDLSLNETETRMLNEVLVEMHLLKHRESLDGDGMHLGGETQCERDNGGNKFRGRFFWEGIAAAGFMFFLFSFLNSQNRKLKDLRVDHDNLDGHVNALYDLAMASLTYGFASTKTDEQQKQELWEAGACLVSSFLRKRAALAKTAGVALEA